MYSVLYVSEVHFNAHKCTCSCTIYQNACRRGRSDGRNRQKHSRPKSPTAVGRPSRGSEKRPFLGRFSLPLAPSASTKGHTDGEKWSESGTILPHVCVTTTPHRPEEEEVLNSNRGTNHLPLSPFSHPYLVNIRPCVHCIKKIGKQSD